MTTINMKYQERQNKTTKINSRSDNKREEEEIQEMEIPEYQDENKEISGVDQNTEYSGVNINNAMPDNPPDLTSTNGNKTPKVDTVDKSDAKEDEN